MRTAATLWLSIAALCIASLPLSGATIHVPGDQPTIQAGIDAAALGDTVMVECGTYFEHDIEMRTGVYLTSETGTDDCVTIDAQQQGRVFYCEAVDSLSAIVGFTITGGEEYGGRYADGGGAWCGNSYLSFMNCTFVGNTAIYAGGLYITESSSLALTNCEFLDNFAPGGSGAISCVGSSVCFTSCVFSGNHSGDPGGAVTLGSSSAAFTDCLFLQNDGGYYGGAVACGSSSPAFSGCTFVANSVYDGDGAGIACRSSSSPLLTSCIFAFNGTGDVISCDSGTSIPVLHCCVMYGNAGGDWVGCIADQYGVDSNFSEDPLFCLEDNPSEPYSLHEGSPCLPANSPCGELVGALGQGCGAVTSIESTSWGAIKALYR